MTSIHRRSHSASSSLDLSTSWNSSTKRAYSNHTAGTGSPEVSPQRMDEPWRQGKRRRRELSPQRSVIAPATGLATTPAEFHLDRRHSTCQISTPSFDFSVPFQTNDSELQQLRSEAFWELHKTVAENGECFVRRMRVWEQTRARAEALNKAKEAQRRGRKRASISFTRSPRHSDQSDDDDDDDEDIQIVSGDTGQVRLCATTRQKRAQSLNMSNDRTPLIGGRSPSLLSDEECPFVLPSTCSSSSSSFTPSLSTSSSQVSLSPRHSPHSFSIPTSASRSEKALAARAFSERDAEVGYPTPDSTHIDE